MNQQKPKENPKPLPDPVSAFKELYDQVWKQAAEQWDQVLRNPLFLSTMAATMEQSMNLTARVQEMVATTLKAMNLPTHHDLQEIKNSIQALRSDVTELHRKIDELDTPPKTTKRQSRRNS
ncbi:MAG: hypothetical protein HY314_17120 [Acidobacteria bacterium]|nr:hypothetical protein [Acidobacteriota bacterium]